MSMRSTGPKPQPIAVFDFDGTIADSLHEVVSTFNRVASDFGLAPVAPDEVQTLRRLTPKAALDRLSIPLWKFPLVVRAVRAAMHERMDRLEPFAGIDDAVRALGRAGYRCCILSSNSSANIRRFLHRHRMEGFELVAGGSSMFGKAAQIRKLLRRTRWQAAHTIYVGDEIRDIEASAEAGVRSAAVSWGYCHPDALRAAGPDYLVDTPAELVAVLARQRPEYLEKV